jgi:biotin carboxyl carrier protein
MRKFKISVNRNWYEVEIKDLDASPISVLVDGELYEVELGPETPNAEAAESVVREPGVLVSEPMLEASGPALRQALRQAQDAAVTGGEVIAPMPGKILAINVGVGDRVQYKEVLCILEAMKMENEIMAPAAGVIKEIRVATGQDVLYGDGLFVIDRMR